MQQYTLEDIRKTKHINLLPYVRRPATYFQEYAFAVHEQEKSTRQLMHKSDVDASKAVKYNDRF